MSDSYYIDNVGGECVVGSRKDVYEGSEYMTSQDDDSDGNQYSELAGINVVMGLEVLEGMFASPGLSGNATVKKIGDWTLTNPSGRFGPGSISIWQHKGDKNSNAKKMTDTVTLPGNAATSPVSIDFYKKKLNGIRADRIHCAKTGKGCDKGNEGNAFTAAGKSITKIGEDMVHVMNQAARLPESFIKETLGRIPIIGAPIKSAIKLSPNEALGGLTSKVLAGERLDQAFLSTAKEQIKAAKEVAPYVQTVMSVVPGVGTGVAAAIAAGTALAEGRTITDALLSSVKGALPGGPVAAMAFDAAVAIAKGESPENVALTAIRNQLPAAAKGPFDVAVAAAKGKNVADAALKAAGGYLPADVRDEYESIRKVATAAAKGKNVKDATLQALRSQLPEKAKKALEVGIAMGAARNIQANTTRKSTKKESVQQFAKDGASIVKKVPKLRGDLPPTVKAARGLSKEGMAGYQAALGVVTKKGVTAHTLAAVRASLSPLAKIGFDHALKSLVNEAHPDWKSLVKGGKVIRGPFRQVGGKQKGSVSGRLIIGGKVVKGHFVRS